MKWDSRGGQAPALLHQALASLSVTEWALAAGYDGVVVDLQHGEVGLEAACTMLRAAPRDSAYTYARVGGLDPAPILRLLDSGARGIIAPTIESGTASLNELFEQVLVPTEEVVETRRGRKVTTERRFFPGYVLVKMEMTDEAYHLIKNTPKVTGFLGSDNKPIPITEAEATRILHQVQEGVERPRPSISFEIGEQVRVADGPFASFNGLVEEVDEERSRLKVAVSIFGRPTPVELEFGQVEKV